jgi:hypothetical protein
MALQLCAVSRSLEMCIKIRLRLEYRPVNHLATELHNLSSKTHSLACSRWCVSYRVVCDPKMKNELKEGPVEQVQPLNEQVQPLEGCVKVKTCVCEFRVV